MHIHGRHARLLDRVSCTTGRLYPVYKHFFWVSEIHLRGLGPIYTILGLGIQTWQRETICWDRNPRHQMPYKEDRDFAIFSQIFMPPTTPLRRFPLRWDHPLWKNKNNNYNNLDTFIEKKDFFMEKFSARLNNYAELSKVSSSINKEDRQHFIKEKSKVHSVTSGLQDQVKPHFAGKYIRQALLKHWNIIDKDVRLKMIFPSHP